jgi:hypothetical protein
MSTDELILPGLVDIKAGFARMCDGILANERLVRAELNKLDPVAWGGPDMEAAYLALDRIKAACEVVARRLGESP